MSALNLFARFGLSQAASGPPPGGPVSFVGGGLQGGSYSYSLSTPAGAKPGDIAVMYMMCRDSGAITMPSGWAYTPGTLGKINPGANNRLHVAYITLPNPIPASYSFTPVNNQSVVWMGVYTGVDASNPIEDEDYALYSTASATRVAPSISCRADGMLVMGASGAGLSGSTRWTPPSGMTERCDYGPSNSASLFAGDEEVTSGSTSGTRTATYITSATGVAHMLSLKPA